jgi:hypothetical protein
MDDQAIAAETGASREKVRSAKANMARGGRTIGTRSYSTGHDYTEEHLREPHQAAEPHPADSAHTVSAEGTSTTPTAAPTPRPRRADRAVRAARRSGVAPTPETFGGMPRISDRDNTMLRGAGYRVGISSAERNKVIGGRDTDFSIRLQANGKWKVFANNTEQSEHDSLEDAILGAKSVERDLATLRSARASTVTTSSDTDAGEGSAGHTPSAPAPTPAPEATPESANAEIERLLAKLSPETRQKVSRDSRRQPKARPSETLVDSRAAAAQAAQIATAERNRAIEPTSPAAREIHREVPSLAEADAPIQEMIAAQARGENPYLNRAKDIFHNISPDIKEERRNKAKHMLAAIAAVGATQSKTALLAKYKELSGSDRVRTLPEDDFEKATFHTLDEVLGNAPVDVELERMKRGFAAKQFARMKPFLKDSWTQANPSAPPPMPTYGDIKSWGEHGGTKPAWAGTTRMALPKEVHDAAHKGADGKPKHPPAWMPIHLAPVWKYVMAKTGDDSAYQARGSGVTPDRSSPTGFKLNMGSQAGFQEGMVINAMRKYIQMRGGASQLVDIPASKLAEVNLSHSDIFKAEDGDLSDKAIKNLIKHKIIDPVALVPFLKKEMKASTRKSFSLVVDLNAPIFKSEKIVKSDLIQKIKQLKQKARHE